MEDNTARQSDKELLNEFKAALEGGSNIDSLPYDLIKKLILHTSDTKSVEAWKDKIRSTINEVFGSRIGAFDGLTYMMIKTHMENVIKQVDTPNVQLIKYGKDMITESLLSLSEILERVGNCKKGQGLNTVSFANIPSRNITIKDIIASIKSYQLDGRTWDEIESIIGIGKTTLTNTLLKYEREELQKKKEQMMNDRAEMMSSYNPN